MCLTVTRIMEIEAKIAQATEQNMPEAEIGVLRRELTKITKEYDETVLFPALEKQANTTAPEGDLSEVHAMGKFIQENLN